MLKEIAKEEETNLPFKMSMVDGTVAADNLIEIVAWLFNDRDYVNDTPEQAPEKRIECCCNVAENFQEHLAGYVQISGGWDHREDGPDIVELLTHPDRTTVIPLTSWRHPVPLVLVRTLYAPHSDIPPVQGDVIWIDPLDDKRMLDSLHKAQIITFTIKETL